MLGRKDYTQDELDHARRAIDQQLAAYGDLAGAIAANGDDKTRAALEAMEPVLFNNMVLALDRCFVHRLRMVTGKDTNPLNEVELLVDSLMNNDAVLRGVSPIKYAADGSVLGLEIGDRIALDADQFRRLADAFLGEIQARFV